MPFVGMFLGGILGAAQFSVMWGFIPEQLATNLNLNAFYWILLIVPLGTLYGTAISALIVRLRDLPDRRALFLTSWGVAIPLGFQAAL